MYIRLVRTGHVINVSRLYKIPHVLPLKSCSYKAYKYVPELYGYSSTLSLSTFGLRFPLTSESIYFSLLLNITLTRHVIGTPKIYTHTHTISGLNNVTTTSEHPCRDEGAHHPNISRVNERELKTYSYRATHTSVNQRVYTHTFFQHTLLCLFRPFFQVPISLFRERVHNISQHSRTKHV